MGQFIRIGVLMAVLIHEWPGDYWCQYCGDIIRPWGMQWSDDHRYMCRNCIYLSNKQESEASWKRRLSIYQP